ncbi:MAG: putative permease [Cellvibrionaceae bacterium]|jgi:predicted permease
MIDILLEIIPIFVLILLGFGLMRFSIPSLEFWHLNDKLVYWVLIPSLLFNRTSRIELSADLIGKYALVIYSAFFAVVILAIVVSKLFKWSAPSMTSVMQGASRHNTFIVLAIAESLYGSSGLSTAALGSAILIPITNIVMVILMVWTLSEGQKLHKLFLSTLRELARNPLIIAVLLGISFNLLAWQNVPVLHETTRLLGAAALPIVLLGVGANIKVKNFTSSWLPVVVSCSLKMMAFPAIIFCACIYFELSVVQTSIAILFGAVPTAAGGYTLAKQLGGDAPLMATIVVVQTGISIITIPITMTLVSMYFGV